MKKNILSGLLVFGLILSGCQGQNTNKDENAISVPETDSDKEMQEALNKTNVKLIDYYITSSKKIGFSSTEEKMKENTTLLILSLSGTKQYKDYIESPKISINDKEYIPETEGYQYNSDETIVFMNINEKIDKLDNAKIEIRVKNEKQNDILFVEKDIPKEKTELTFTNKVEKVGDVFSLGEKSNFLRLNSGINTENNIKKLRFFSWGENNKIDKNKLKLIDVDGNDITNDLPIKFEVMLITDSSCLLNEENTTGFINEKDILIHINKDLDKKELGEIIQKLNASSIKYDNVIIPIVTID